MVRATTTKNDCLAYVHPAQSRYLCNRVSWQWRQPHITEKDHHIWLLAAKYPHAAKTEAKEDPKNKNHKRAHRQMTSRKPPGNRCTVKMRQRGKSIRNKCEYRKRHTQIYRWNGRTEQEKKNRASWTQLRVWLLFQPKIETKRNQNDSSYSGLWLLLLLD